MSTLSEAAVFLSGGTPKKDVPEYWNGDIPWYSASNMSQRFLGPTESRITRAGLDAGSRLAPKGATLLLVRGSGLFNHVPICFTDHPVAFNQDVKAICAKDHVDPQFLHFWIESLRNRLNQNIGVTGIGAGKFDLDFLKNLPFPIISKPQQETIGLFAAAFDRKIDLNRRMSETLEAMARALFKDWFVDFGPTRAKMEGREPYLAPELWALFPDRLDEEGKPDGWSIGTISDICTLVVNGGTPSRSTAAYWMDGDVRWFKTGELSDSFVLDSQEKITQVGVVESSAKILPRDAVIMAIYAAPTVGRLGIFTAPSAFNQACTGMVAKPEIGPWFLYLALFFGRDWFNDRANGAAQQNISKRIVEGYAVQIAGRNVFAAFNGLVTPLFKSVRSNVEQSQTLAQTRDLLLPKLMSGEIRVREAERMVEDVV